MTFFRNLLIFLGIAILSAAIALGITAIFVIIDPERIFMGPGYLAFLSVVSPALFLYFRYQRQKRGQPATRTWLLWLPSLLLIIAGGRLADENFGSAVLNYLAGYGYFKDESSEERYQKMMDEYTYDYPKPNWAPEVCDCIRNIQGSAAFYDPDLQTLCEQHAAMLSQSEKKERLREAYNNGCIRASDLE